MGLFRRKKKEVTFCPNCGTPVPAGLAFCDSCGIRVTAPPSCAKCHLPLAPDTNFCESCGTPVGTAPESPGPEEKEPAGSKKEKSGKSRRGKKKAPKKDEFVHPAMLAPENEEAEPPANPPILEEECADDTGITTAPPCGDSMEPGIPTSPSLRHIPKRTLVLVIVAIICLVLGAVVLTGLVNGPAPAFTRIFTAPADTPAATPLPVTSSPTPAIAEDDGVVTTSVFVTRPTQVPPESYRIWLQAERDPITSMVTVLFNGGKGQRAVREVSVRLTRSDGQVLVQAFRPLVVGEGAELQGTKYADRLEVNVTYYTGETYTVIDRIFPYKQRN
ncbi:MAG: hypothetical protein CVV32_09590 [Methanomicrobiales archaeon HGW-Methanomicrobiales-3]|jgi:hypothetical protein|nr:MAG: hypothetical protein CVV32_09590 [Methanomicrobiales archaeon HGW-Methanomicrobiales-3]